MAIRTEYFVDATTAQRWSLDSDSIVPLGAYYSGNNIVLTLSNGASMAVVFSSDAATSTSAYLIGVELYAPDGTLMVKSSGFSVYIDNSGDLVGAAMAQLSSLDEYIVFSSASDLVHIDVANDDISDYQDRYQYSSSPGKLLYVDGGNGADTLYEDYWDSNDYELSKDASGRYFLTFLPTNTTSEIINFEYINLPDTGLMTLDEYMSFKNPVILEPIPETKVVELSDGTYSLNFIADIFGNVLYLKGLEETVAGDSHTITYNGLVYDYSEVDSFITTVTRDGSFTEEFATEIAEAYPSSAGITYSTALNLIGINQIDAAIVNVAGIDGSYIS